MYAPIIIPEEPKMYDDTNWFKGYVAGLEEAVKILRYSGLTCATYEDKPSPEGVLVNYLSAVKQKQMPWPSVKGD